jgi:hypothetical protein
MSKETFGDCSRNTCHDFKKRLSVSKKGKTKATERKGKKITERFYTSHLGQYDLRKLGDFPRLTRNLFHLFLETGSVNLFQDCIVIRIFQQANVRHVCDSLDCMMSSEKCDFGMFQNLALAMNLDGESTAIVPCSERWCHLVL